MCKSRASLRTIVIPAEVPGSTPPRWQNKRLLFCRCRPGDPGTSAGMTVLEKGLAKGVSSPGNLPGNLPPGRQDLAAPQRKTGKIAVFRAFPQNWHGHCRDTHELLCGKECTWRTTASSACT